MDVTRVTAGDTLHLKVDGRIDGYWADHLDAALAAAISEGHHRIALDCSKVSFLSSAGIGAIVKHYKALAAIQGSLQVVEPSHAVVTVLRMTRLADVLIGLAAHPAAAPPSPAPSATVRRVNAPGVVLDVYDLDAHNTLTCRTVGDSAALATGGFTEDQSVSLAGVSPAFAIGVGAFGDCFADCRPRFGELLSVAGATAYQPADGTNVADYLVARGPLASDVRLLYGLVCDGAFSHLVRFDAAPGGGVALSDLAAACCQLAGADGIGIVIVAETAGLVGAALRRSPADVGAGVDFFAHPSVRTRLSFTAERTFPQSVSLTAGVVRTRVAASSDGQLRPIGGGLAGHFHAAAFRFQPIQKGAIPHDDTIAQLFEAERLMGVMHLLHDDRGAAGAGESELIRGACWIAPLAAEQ